MRTHSLFCFQNFHGSSHLDLSVVKFLPNIYKILLKEFMFQFKYTKNELQRKFFLRFCIGDELCFAICRNFKNVFYGTSCNWLLLFARILYKINATRYSVVESCSTVNQNIVKSKVKFKINYASMNDYSYGKLRPSLKVVSLQIC